MGSLPGKRAPSGKTKTGLHSLLLLAHAAGLCWPSAMMNSLCSSLPTVTAVSTLSWPGTTCNASTDHSLKSPALW